MNIKDVLQFVSLIDAFKRIRRDIPLSSGEPSESDADHSYQLAMISWYLAVSQNDLDINKILRYALVHDLPEIYAGDTPAYTTNNSLLKEKEVREKEAILRLQKEFPNFNDLHTWIENYHCQADQESKFVYAVDKLLPIMSIYLDSGHAWKTHDINLESLIQNKRDLIAISPTVLHHFDTLLGLIKKDPELFNKKTRVFKEAISHDGERCDIHHVDTDSFEDIPDELKVKAHAVCLHKGKAILVNHIEWDIWGIPGGTRDPGESIEETLAREVLEETNCKVIDKKPIAYQAVIKPSGEVCHYRLLYLCSVIPEGVFVEDPDQTIHKVTWIEPTEFENYIEDKEFKKVVFRRAIKMKNT